MQIKIFTTAYLLASKIEAFGSRGKNQFYFSKDFEDIITLFNGSPNLLAEISASESEVRTFITAWVRTERKNLDAMAPAFLAAGDRLAGRDKLLLETIDLLARLL
jgi:hypothetical protein